MYRTNVLAQLAKAGIDIVTDKHVADSGDKGKSSVSSDIAHSQMDVKRYETTGVVDLRRLTMGKSDNGIHYHPCSISGNTRQNSLVKWNFIFLKSICAICST